MSSGFRTSHSCDGNFGSCDGNFGGHIGSALATWLRHCGRCFSYSAAHPKVQTIPLGRENSGIKILKTWVGQTQPVAGAILSRMSEFWLFSARVITAHPVRDLQHNREVAAERPRPYRSTWENLTRLNSVEAVPFGLSNSTWT